MFKKRENVVEIEEGNLLSPKLNNDGPIPVITMCANTKEILMHGYMNTEALKKTIETKEAHYFSRSRKIIWHKPYEVHDHFHLYYNSHHETILLMDHLNILLSLHLGHFFVFHSFKFLLD